MHRDGENMREDVNVVLTDAESPAAHDKHAGGALDPLLEPLEPGDSALLRAPHDVYDAVLVDLVRYRAPQVDGRREVAAGGVDEILEAKGAIGDAVLRKRLV